MINDNYFQIGVGDIASKSIYKGVIGKSRLADEKNIILLKLNYPRHWKGIKNIKLQSMYHQYALGPDRPEKFR